DEPGDGAGAVGQGPQGNGELPKADGTPGGSCADGQSRPWELGEPSPEAPGMSEPEQEQIIHEVAKKIEARGCGTGSSGMRGWANEVLNPKIDPRAKLLRAVRRACEHTIGVGEYTYRRPNRRNANPDVVRPSNVQPVPRITVVIDTSGSMD